MPEQDVAERVDTRLSDGDHERLAHYVAKDDIVRSNVEGVEVEALCGKRWIPHRDPDRYPVCRTCQEIMDQIRRL